MRHIWVLAADLGMVALSAFIALLIRDNFIFHASHWEAIIPYAALTVVSAAVVFGILGPHKTLWQYTSLLDALRIVTAVTIALLLALFVSFVGSRLEGIARSIPVIHWLLLVAALVGTRILARIWHERRNRAGPTGAVAPVQHLLIVGASHLTELYLESLDQYAAKAFEVVGILSDKREFRGRVLRRLVILGTPEELLQVMAQLEVHGTTVDRIAVMQPLSELTRHASEALLTIERTSSVKVDWLVERLGFTEGANEIESSRSASHRVSHSRRSQPATKVEVLSLGRFGYVKRAFDIVAAIILTIVVAPLALLVALLVAIDVGLPLVFWQRRPGRGGRSFKLYKFCTMRAAHDANGNRIPDERRSTNMGCWLRRARLDELPQLFNILIGEMSFVGPRPLLPWDQPDDITSRLAVRPGLTGLAQAYGERTMSPDDKNTLDLWYIENAAFWLDMKIMLRTVMVLVRGERIDHHTLRSAREGLEGLKSQSAADSLVASGT